MRHRRSIEVLTFVALGTLTACSASSESSGSGGAAGETSTGGSGTGGGASGAGGSKAGAGGATGGSGGAAAGTGGATGGSGGATGGSGGSTAGAGGSTGGSGGSTAGAGGSPGGSGGASACDPGEGPCGNVDANGVCMSATKVQFCRNPPVGSSCPAVLETITCQGNQTCMVDSHGLAQCTQPAGTCQPGATQCMGNTLQTCKADGSGWDSMDCATGTTCGADPKTGDAVCLAQVTQNNVLHGCVEFEKHGYDPNTHELNAVHTAPAWLQFIAVYNGSNYVGSAITGPDGCYDAQLSEPATSSTTVYMYSMDFAPGADTPLIAVVRNDDPDITSQASSDYWFWSNQGDSNCGMAPAGVHDAAAGMPYQYEMDMMTVPESCGSGAINVFQWVRYGMYRLGDPNYGLQTTRNQAQQSIAVFWSPGVHSVCGACFYAGGGATVTPAGTTTSDKYDTLMQISGDDPSPTQWSYSVMSHETGHYAMFNYSRTPGEGGPHYVAQASKPGLAWSEGWATAFSMWNQSNDTYDPNTQQYVTNDPNNPPDFDAQYIDQQQGTVFWVQIDKATWSQGALELPDPNSGIEQNINENVVSDMVWHLWQPADAGTASGDSHYHGVNPDGAFNILQSAPVTTLPARGYTRVNLVNFFDGAICTNTAGMSDVDDVSGQVTFPYDNQPACQ